MSGETADTFTDMEDTDNTLSLMDTGKGRGDTEKAVVAEGCHKCTSRRLLVGAGAVVLFLVVVISAGAIYIQQMHEQQKATIDTLVGRMDELELRLTAFSSNVSLSVRCKVIELD